MEIIYGHVLGPKTLAAVKREQLQQDMRDPALLWYLATLAMQLCTVVGVLVHFGCFAPVLVDDLYSARSWAVSITPAYVEFLLLTMLKDVTSMQWLHRWMHDSNHSYLKKIHMKHHSHGAELNNINGALIDPVDLFFENSVGPFLLVSLKAIMGFPAQISILAFLINISSEGSTHSLNPYAVCYYFPPIDAMMKGNIAHNLHHAHKLSNLLAHPWNHLTDGYQSDLQAYNKCMDTKVQF